MIPSIEILVVIQDHFVRRVGHLREPNIETARQQVSQPARANQRTSTNT
jgi:hypothetical protein